MLDNSYSLIISNTVNNSSNLTLCIPVNWCHRKVKTISSLNDSFVLKKYEQVIKEICLVSFAIFAYLPCLLLGVAATCFYQRTNVTSKLPQQENENKNDLKNDKGEPKKEKVKKQKKEQSNTRFNHVKQLDFQPTNQDVNVPKEKINLNDNPSNDFILKTEFEADKLENVNDSQSLTNLALEYYKRGDIKRRQIPSLSHLSSLGSNPEDHQLIEGILENQRGFCLGESHQDPAPKKFLLDNLERLKALGVKYIFYEGLSYQKQQILDNYHTNNDFYGEINGVFQYINSCNISTDARYTDLAVIKKAKEVGIKIIAADIIKSSYNQNEITCLKRRRIQMNYTMAVLAEKYLALDPTAKFVAWMGWNHLVRNQRIKNVLGVSELLGCPNIVVSSKINYQAPKVQYENEQFKNNSQFSHIDLTYFQAPVNMVIMS